MKTVVRTCLVLVVLSGCALDASTDGSGPGGSAGGKADDLGEGVATITFGGDFSEELVGAIVPGAPLRVVYDPARLPGCRGESGGQPVWGISGAWYVDGGEPASIALAEREDGLLEGSVEAVPVGGEIAFYFTVTNVWGCHEYDSDYGNDYRFPIAHPGPEEQTVISFDAEGGVALSGPVVGGSVVRIQYDPSRVEECRGTSGGYPVWNVYGYASVDGGEAEGFEVTRVEGSERVPVDAEILVRPGQLLELWFQFSNRWGCLAYDSNDGQNFEFSIDPA